MAAKHAQSFFEFPLKMSEASKDLYGKKLKLKKLNQMKKIFVPASIGVLSCL